MDSVSAEDILRGIKGLVDGGDADGEADALPGTTEFPPYRQALDLALNHCWRSEWWPDLMRGQWRYFRQNWLAATIYNKTAEVYDAATQKYFQCLRDAVTGAGQSPTDSTGVERSAYWAECRTSYTGRNWVTGTVYAVGDKVFYPVTMEQYQCHTAHTSSGTLVPDATAGNERWGLLTPFDRYIQKNQSWEDTIIGDCFDVKNGNPKVTPRWKGLDWGNSENGVQIRDAVSRAFVEFRLPRPRLFGTLYDADTAYAAGRQIYYPVDDENPLPGNFYNVLETTTAGETPETDADKFELIEIPQLFYGALVHLAATRVLVADDDARAAAPAGFAEQDLAVETDVIYRQQGQSPPIPARTY